MQFKLRIKSDQKWNDGRENRQKNCFKNQYHVSFEHFWHFVLFVSFTKEKDLPNIKKFFFCLFFRSFYFNYCSIRWPLSALSNIWTPFLLTLFSLWISMQFKENCREKEKKKEQQLWYFIELYGSIEFVHWTSRQS